MDSFFIDFWFAFSGTVLGFLAGLLPGVGNVVMILVTYPLILEADLFQMLLYYLALISSSQFSGSVIATVFGVPGESSSLPAVTEGNRMFQRGVGNLAISNAALGSIVGSLISVLVISLFLPISVELIKNFYNNNVQLVILLLASVTIIFIMGRGVIENIILFAIGIFLALIGGNKIPWFMFWPDVIPYDIFPRLKDGLPLFPVMVSLYVFPILLNTATQFKDQKIDQDYKDETPLRKHFAEFWKNKWSVFRGSAVGCFIGLVPHVGTSVSSNLSYAWEKHTRIRNKTYNPNGDINSLVSAETANNSTTMMSMMPLMLIGIPISASEALLLGLIEANNFMINWETTIQIGMFERLVLWFIFINLFSFILSWPAVKYVNYLKAIKLNHILIITGVGLCVLVAYIGSLSWDTEYYIAVMLGLAPLGYMLRKTEPLILVVAFILQDKILASLSVFYAIHFG